MTHLEYNLGRQPLDAVMTERGLTNHQLVSASGEFLTHKVVGKARKGRRLTRRAQEKIRAALNRTGDQHAYRHEELFNYTGS
ncbi:MAG TPA: hypothetical protein PJ991_07575 [Kiritimatiellia bacterium]|nr:hypothetical protein [Kiritimatiellia bacterium]